MISVDSVHLSFNRDGCIEKVLDNICFSVAQQSSCAIIGPSGCGKTSLLFLLAGLLQQDAGEVRISSSSRCGTILQNYGLFPWKTVAQNIGLGLVLQKKEKRIIDRRTDALLEDMGLSGFGSHYPIELSGGMQQRVALARALAVDPKILLMDEPLSSLDALTRERLQNLILEIQQLKKITMVLVTHSIEEAVFLGRKIIVLSERPARVLHTFDNTGVGSPRYRQSENFFHLCTEVRTILGVDENGKEA
ncbi:MAG: ATP-binding cassette domain-containing protein [Desulfopila sp.]|jgi:NitT/TauT family transport system ATP-binding protein|nr:ATP-binding cassette domain-containing protein [Desulfopila sp.]